MTETLRDQALNGIRASQDYVQPIDRPSQYQKSIDYNDYLIAYTAMVVASNLARPVERMNNIMTKGIMRLCGK